jgi:hypothetical protein
MISYLGECPCRGDNFNISMLRANRRPEAEALISFMARKQFSKSLIRTFRPSRPVCVNYLLCFFSCLTLLIITWRLQT